MFAFRLQAHAEVLNSQKGVIQHSVNLGVVFRRLLPCAEDEVFQFSKSAVISVF